jgi:hypothetical protein
VKRWLWLALLALPPLLVVAAWCYSYDMRTMIGTSRWHLVNGMYAQHYLGLDNDFGHFTIWCIDQVPDTARGALWLSTFDGERPPFNREVKWTVGQRTCQPHSGIGQLLADMWQSSVLIQYLNKVSHSRGVTLKIWDVSIPYWVLMVLASLPLARASWRYLHRKKRGAASVRFEVLGTQTAAWTASPPIDGPQH